MKNAFVWLLVTLAVLPTYGQVRKKQDIQKDPLDISEYFLILPVEPNWGFDGGGSDPFTGRQKYFKTNPKITVTIDKKNAYITILDQTEELESRFTMCYFVKTDKSKLIAVSYYGEGGDCDSHVLKFYTYASGKWTDVTSKVFPTLSLKNFKTPEKQIVPVEFLYTLPQFGTNISVKAAAVCEQDNAIGGQDYMVYFEQYKKIPFKTLQLKWNKEKGVFEPGEVK